nr:hypothetical protein FA04_11895 [Ensifer adhaerens]
MRRHSHCRRPEHQSGAPPASSEPGRPAFRNPGKSTRCARCCRSQCWPWSPPGRRSRARCGYP